MSWRINIYTFKAHYYVNNRALCNRAADDTGSNTMDAKPDAVRCQLCEKKYKAGTFLPAKRWLMCLALLFAGCGMGSGMAPYYATRCELERGSVVYAGRAGDQINCNAVWWNAWRLEDEIVYHYKLIEPWRFKYVDANLSIYLYEEAADVEAVCQIYPDRGTLHGCYRNGKIFLRCGGRAWGHEYGHHLDMINGVEGDHAGWELNGYYTMSIDYWIGAEEMCIYENNGFSQN